MTATLLAQPDDRPLTDRQRQVLAAIARRGSHGAISPEYVAKVLRVHVTEIEDDINALIVAGVVRRCYGGTLLMLTDAGRAVLGCAR